MIDSISTVVKSNYGKCPISSVILADMMTFPVNALIYLDTSLSKNRIIKTR